MQLKDYEIERAKVPLPGKKGEHFEVRGLCADDLTFLITLHHGPITKALAQYQQARGDVMTKKNLTGFVLTLAQDFPDLVAEVISAASDSLDDATRKVARRLPITTQIVALNEILKLTMQEVDGIKNLLAEMRARVEELAQSDGKKS